MAGALSASSTRSWTEIDVAKAKQSKKSGNTSSLALMYTPPVAEWYRDLLDKLTRFQEYQEDNWDDEGAPAITHKTFLSALALLKELIKNINLPRPNLIAGYAGDIVFLWARNGFELEIIVAANGKYHLSLKDCSRNEKTFYPDLSLSICVGDLFPLFSYNISSHAAVNN